MTKVSSKSLLLGGVVASIVALTCTIAHSKELDASASCDDIAAEIGAGPALFSVFVGHVKTEDEMKDKGSPRRCQSLKRLNGEAGEFKAKLRYCAANAELFGTGHFYEFRTQAISFEAVQKSVQEIYRSEQCGQL